MTKAITRYQVSASSRYKYVSTKEEALAIAKEWLEQGFNPSIEQKELKA